MLITCAFSQLKDAFCSHLNSLHVSNVVYLLCTGIADTLHYLLMGSGELTLDNIEVGSTVRVLRLVDDVWLIVPAVGLSFSQ